MRTFWPNDRTLLSRNPSAAASVSVSISVSISTRLISHECPVFPRHHPLFTFPVAIIETLLVCRLPVTGYIELGHFLRLDFLHVPHSKLCGDGPKLGKKRLTSLREFIGTDSWLAFWILWHFVIEFHVGLILKF